MNYTDLITPYLEGTYKAAFGLMDLVTDEELDWKPETGENWMTLGQLLRHITDACGACFKGFHTGDWGMPEGVSFEDVPPEEMMPPAEKMPTVDSVAQAREMLEADKALALLMMAEAGEEGMQSRLVAAPWAPERQMPLGSQFLGMVGHLESHKSQLFYYLKLMGKPVNTVHLWGGM